MSASLVGSEMCIRDRPLETDVASAATPAEGERVPDTPPPRQAVTLADTVSYTHLTLPTICSV
eukprot:12033207-Alexandrium_andersonii.AAC.1